MNLFFKKLTGKLHSTEKMERLMVAEEERIARYRQVENSAELQEYLSLKEIVGSKEFAQKRYNLTMTKYKSTDVFRTLQEYNSLRKNKMLQIFIEVNKSELLREYLAFRNSEDYVRLQSEKEVRNSLQLKRMQAFEKSKEYKAYLQYKSSSLPKRYEELQTLVASSEFHDKHAFWANPKRWNTTEEFRQEVRMKQLESMPDIRFYLKTDRKEIERLESYWKTFDDEFNWLRLSDSKWRAGFAYSNKALKNNHSFANEQQANNGGKNVGAVDGKLNIFTKRERTIAPAWDTKLGFINKEFGFTSDLVQTADSFKQKGGLFMAKLRVEGNIHHSFWLGSGSKLPMISVMHFNGKRITVGNFAKSGFDGDVVKGISAKQYFIYSLLWTEKELVWYVNNVEVYRTSRELPKEELYLAFSSFIDEHQHPSEGCLNVAWVKAFKF